MYYNMVYSLNKSRVVEGRMHGCAVAGAGGSTRQGAQQEGEFVGVGVREGLWGLGWGWRAGLWGVGWGWRAGGQGAK